VTLTRRRAAWILGAITAVGAALRFYNLGWGAPYYHFHIDEHFVLGPADAMHRSMREAVMWPKFFMYSPLLMYLVTILRTAYEAVGHPLDLSVPGDAVIYTVLGRSISAAFGTATIPVVYVIAQRIAGRLAGLLAAALLACSVIHLRDSHFASTDVSLTFACTLALLAALHIAERGSVRSLVAAGVAFAGAVLFKYSGAFVLGVIGVAYLVAPGRPAGVRPLGAWIRWGARGTIPIVVGVATFLLLDPLVIQYWDKFQSDVKTWVVDPITGATRPIWTAQFADVGSPQLYWFTNLIWWSVGPALEVAGLAGIVWLCWRRERKALVAASFPVIYYLAAAVNNSAPMIRYVVPLCPPLAIAAGVLCADWLRSGRGRALAVAFSAIVVGATGLYAAAYMNVFIKPDARLAASRWLVQRVPQGSRILVEHSHNIPPMGSYFTAPDFNKNYVLWGNRDGHAERHDYYHLFTLDVYRFLYNPGVTDETRSEYIASRLPLADYIVMDDTFVQFYQHLPESTHRVPKQYYADLFAGRLGFRLVRTFKVYPSLFGVDINDDDAELSFRLFDHPRVFVFQRTAR
jgi:4-amino-4-deoxy-L-arabinose transferase-like glycosyltransferase